ncbi:family 16 glycosylhydrolase [Aureitalea sp. L0-47]|uniref:family 16 glycosylhydrolase n=1 Tax=Aureitalea sp. L0-47 TaxID=2816962 RepID=UPI0022371511|nr:family 16 glycosylhydrolase [Aureitalea sp. L0-47]MCW5519517.1 family 16 glycosylhydrolase [Aureitalea sp. L0-47]
MKFYTSCFLFLLGITIYAQDPAYELVWADEFEGNGAINADNWHHQTLLPNGSSWYNGEIQHYTDRQVNSYVDNGTLKIVAKRETYTDQGVTKDFTSARLNSKYAFTYSKVEIRAKLPTGVGTWPAMWTLGQNIAEPGGYWEPTYGSVGWPACGEIDIMEHWGDNQNFVQSAIHTPSSFGNTVNKGGTIIPTASTEFHVYTMEWDEDKIVFAVDDVVHYTYNPSVQNADTWPFTANQYILLNVAILPNIAPSFTESSLEIDYVRVYEKVTLGTIDAEPKGMGAVINPVGEQLEMLVHESAVGSNMFVYDITGRLVDRFEIGQTRVVRDSAHWSPGLYLARLQGQGSGQMVKLVKE